MEFTINPKCEMWGKIKNLNTLVTVENVNTGKKIFDGRVLIPTQQMSQNGMFTITYTCESKLSYLNDSRPRYAKLQNVSVVDSFAFFINRHNSLVPEHKRFKVGNVTVENNTDNVYKFVSYGTTLEEIQDNLIDKLGGVIKMREESDGTYLDYLATVGELKNAPIKLRKNLQDMKREIDPTGVVTRIIPLGARLETPEGQTADASMPRLDIKSVNNGLDYIDDNALISEFGIIEGILELDDVNQASVLKLRGQQFLSQQRAARISYDVSALNMYLIDKTLDEYEVGNWYPVDNIGLAIKENLQVIGLKINSDSPQKNTLSIGEKQVTLTDYQIAASKSARKSLKIQEVVDRQSLSIVTLENSNVEMTTKYNAVQASYNNLATTLEIDDVSGTSLALFNLKTSIDDLTGTINTYDFANMEARITALEGGTTPTDPSNLFNMTTAKAVYIDSDGSEKTSTEIDKTSDFVTVDTLKDYRYTQQYNNSTDSVIEGYLYVAFYNAIKVFIGHEWRPRGSIAVGAKGQFIENVTTFPTNTVYMRIGGNAFSSATLVVI